MTGFAPVGSYFACGARLRPRRRPSEHVRAVAEPKTSKALGVPSGQLGSWRCREPKWPRRGGSPVTDLFSRFTLLIRLAGRMSREEAAEWLSRRRAAYSVLSLRMSGGSSAPIAVLLLDVEQDQLLFRFRRDLDKIASEESLPVLEGMRDELANWAAEQSAKSLYLTFLDTLSNAVTISDPREVPPDSDLRDYLDRAFTKEVANVRFARR